MHTELFIMQECNLILIHSGNQQHSYMPVFNNRFINSINRNQDFRSKNGQNYLSYDERDLQPATSLQRSTQP